tara:strand:- start:3902 stop:6448 length:2547 start_codon:yes stop_codon:yes gene_type:complete
MAAGEDLSPISLADVKIDSKITNFLYSNWDIKEFYPPQKEALAYSLEGRNLMLTIPTASGKSLVAYLTMIHRLKTDLEGFRGLYIVPLKALASEKVEEIRELAKLVGLTVGIAIGERSGETRKIEEADILVCTSEKLDSMLRSRTNLIDKIGVVVVDEFHLLQDINRGPTLEVLLSRIRHSKPDAQIVALSATVGNPLEMANWLDAKLIKSDWRPIQLHSGTLTGLDIKVHRIDGPKEQKWPDIRTIEGKSSKRLQAVLDDTVKSEGQILIFVNSRASTQKEARELSKHVIREIKKGSLQYTKEMEKKWTSIASSLNRREDISSMGRSLVSSIKGGIAFHHAGLSHFQRKIIEEKFRNGELLAIVATPTLAQGINLPARRVIIRDYRRWNSVAGGSIPVSVSEIRQMLGRAGRPSYDDAGDAWIVARDTEEEIQIVERYLVSDPEDVTSKLANSSAIRASQDPALLTHILSIISNAGIKDRDSISRFFAKTFLATQMEKKVLEQRIDDVISWLFNNGMISKTGDSEEVMKRIRKRENEEEPKEENWYDDMPTWAKQGISIPGLEISNKEYKHSRNLTPRKGPAIFGFEKASQRLDYEEHIPDSATMTYEATSLGRRISRLYLNPISGRIIRDGLGVAMNVMSGDDEIHQISPLGLIHLTTCTPDFLSLWPRKEELETILSAIHNHERELLAEPVDMEQERRMKGVLVIKEWINEKSMEEIENEWNVQPGDLRGRVDLVEWLLFAMREILSEDEDLRSLQPDGHRELLEAISELHRRVRNGCKTDLLGLVTIRGIGRIRAREMVSLLGVENASDVSLLTERDRSRLADLRGWSPKLVDNIVNEAKRISK